MFAYVCTACVTGKMQITHDSLFVHHGGAWLWVFVAETEEEMLTELLSKFILQEGLHEELETLKVNFLLKEISPLTWLILHTNIITAWSDKNIKRQITWLKISGFYAEQNDKQEASSVNGRQAILETTMVSLPSPNII